jgi:mRNA interferase RelE/StbE
LGKSEERFETKMTQIIFNKIAKKQLANLPQTVQDQVAKKIEYVKIEPFRYLEQLKGQPFYKIRVGQYRLICDFQHNAITIYVLRIASRETIYKFLKKNKF